MLRPDLASTLDVARTRPFPMTLAIRLADFFRRHSDPCVRRRAEAAHAACIAAESADPKDVALATQALMRLFAAADEGPPQ